MHRIAIFSDVHGNASALMAVLHDIDQQGGITQIIFAGDACLFGPRPKMCQELLDNRSITCLVGNTDLWILEPPPIEESFDNHRREQLANVHRWCQWTADKIGLEGRKWLEYLTSTFELRISPKNDGGDDLLIVHANPLDLMQIVFPSEDEQLRRYGSVRQSDGDLDPLLHEVHASMLAFGHIHIPFRRRWRQLNLVNISSVSLPGDGDPRAKYAILTWHAGSGWAADLRRVDYDNDDEIAAYERYQPPGWEKSVELLRTRGCIPQVV
jgi:predicted phosphodiesterase